MPLTFWAMFLLIYLKKSGIRRREYISFEITEFYLESEIFLHTFYKHHKIGSSSLPNFYKNFFNSSASWPEIIPAIRLRRFFKIMLEVLSKIRTGFCQTLFAKTFRVCFQLTRKFYNKSSRDFLRNASITVLN